MSITISHSPVRPEYIEGRRLLWAVTATAHSTTERGGRALPQDQGLGHKADAKRFRDHVSGWTPEHMQGFIDFVNVAGA